MLPLSCPALSPLQVEESEQLRTRGLDRCKGWKPGTGKPRGTEINICRAGLLPSSNFFIIFFAARLAGGPFFDVGQRFLIFGGFIVINLLVVTIFLRIEVFVTLLIQINAFVLVVRIIIITVRPTYLR